MRRTVDVAVGALLLVLLSPVIAVTMLGVLVGSGRPVVFRQQRSGWHGTEFSIVKLRTMRPERFAGEPDADRLGRWGRLMRASSLDELPQLVNVVRGEMSLIGPRPTLPEQVARYDERERGRLAVRPGMTGWAQVNGRNSLSWPERIELDLWYVEHRSLLLDLKIVGLTALRLVRPGGITGEGGVNPDFPHDGPGPVEGAPR
jgi:lipopolysaccharide/colanic/teichoic acid biosynthesis glycosyltransferase